MIIKTENIPTELVNRKVSELDSEKALTDFFKSKNYDQHLFIQDVEKFISNSNLKKTDIAFALSSIMTPAQMYSLLNGNRKPSKREYVLALGVALHLTVEEMNVLLKDAQHRGLDAKRSTGDAVIIYSLNQKLDVDATNELLVGSKSEYIFYEL